MNNGYIIDTNSLIALAHYYSPFDGHGIVFDLVKTQFSCQNWVLSSKVLQESKRVERGIVVNTFGFLKSVPVMKLSSPVSSQQHKQIDTWVSNAAWRKKPYYATVKSFFVKDADYEIIMLARQRNLCVVTEENRRQNHPPSPPSPKVVFKKIPLICDQISVGCINVAELLKKSDPNLIFSN